MLYFVEFLFLTAFGFLLYIALSALIEFLRYAHGVPGKDIPFYIRYNYWLAFYDSGKHLPAVNRWSKRTSVSTILFGILFVLRNYLVEYLS